MHFGTLYFVKGLQLHYICMLAYISLIYMTRLLNT